MRLLAALLLTAALALPAPAAPPATAEAHIAIGRAALADLTDLKLEAPLARQVAFEVLGTFAFGLEDEIRLVMDALRVDLAPGVLKVPLRWLLGVLAMRGLDTRLAAEALATAPADAAARLSMILEGCRRGSYACVTTADELLLGVTQLVRFVTKAVTTVEKLTGRVEVIPGAARAARAIRRAIVKRLVRALDSVVYLATRPLKQPLRSRVRAAAAILTTVLFRWDPTAIGLPGPTTGAVLIAKAYLLGGPRIGAFSRLQRAVDQAARLALDRSVRGPLDRAAHKALATLEAVMSESRRRSRLAGIERHSAKIAGVASDIATILTIADPSGVAKVVAAVGRVLQGTLVVHATYLSASMLHKIPREVSRMVGAAFDPDGPGPADAPRAKRDSSVREAPASPSSTGTLDAALDQLAVALPAGGELDRLAPPVDALERASDALAPRAPDADLLRHDLATCALLANCLDLPTTAKQPGVPRRLLEQVQEVRVTGAALVAPRGKRGDEPHDDPGPQLAIDAPAAVSLADGGHLDCLVENDGTEPARGLKMQFGARTEPLADLNPGSQTWIRVPVAGTPDSALLLIVRDASGTESARAIWIRP